MTSYRCHLERIFPLTVALILGAGVAFAPVAVNTTQAASPTKQQADTAGRLPVYHALIFANDQYQSLTPLPSAAADFKVMREFFDKAGYRVWAIGGDGRIRNVQAFYEYLTVVRDEIKPGDVVVIFYSGHGFHFGYQNWLVPHDYPAGPINPQTLFKYAVGLNDVINGLAEKRIDYVVAILDSCRTTSQFPMGGGVSAGELTIPDPILPGFNFSGPSLIAWLIGAPTHTGGQALGTSAPTQPSLYTGLLAKVLETHTKLNEVQSELRVAADDLLLAGTIGPNDLSPRFINNDLDFDFSPKADPLVRARQARAWKNVMREPSRRMVRSYLVRNPGSAYSTVAWKYLDEHADEPVDGSTGTSATDAEKIEAAFAEGKTSGKLIAIATPGFTAKFPRNALGHEPTTAQTVADAIVYADKYDDIGELFSERYNEKGSKVNFDVDQLRGAGSLKGSTKLYARSAPGSLAQVIAEFDASTSFKIGDMLFEGANDTLFARVETGLNGEPTSESTWVGFQKDPKAPEFNVLNRALEEAYINAEGLSGQSSENTVAAITAQVKRKSTEILWVSVAVDDRTVDLAPLQAKLKGARSETERANVNAEIERTSRFNQRTLADANLRSLDVRLQLIDAGIDGKRISIVGDRTGKLGERIRLRYFGSR